jgi:hypothetical protein
MTFGADDEKQVTRAAELLAAGLAPDVGGIRHAIAGARIAYEDARDDYVDNKATAVLLQWIAAIPFEGVRAAGGADTPDDAVRAARDQAAGKTLAALISRAAARDDSKEPLDVPA